MPLFSVAELLEMAVKDEETGIAFYEALAQKTASPQLRERCLEISEEESGHRKRFEEMLEEVGKYHPMEEYPGQYAEYVRVLLDSRAFPEPEDGADKALAAAGDVEAIDIGIRMERDTLLFLQVVSSFVPKTHVHFVEEVIEEERTHLVELTEMRQKLA